MRVRTGQLATERGEQQRMSRHSARGPAWERLRAQVLREEIACHRCGSTWFDPRPRSPMSKSVDHLTPLALGGDPLDRANCRLAHYGPCNSSPGQALQRQRRRRIRRASRTW